MFGLILGAASLPASAELALEDIQTPHLVTRVACTIVIDKGGRVVEYRPHTEMPAPIGDRIREMVQAIRFVPVEDNGKVVNAQVDMRVVVTAEEIGNGDMRLALDNLVFPNDEATNGPHAQGRSPILNKTSPTYPAIALHAGAEADQLAVLRFDATGKVVDATIEQSALVHGRATPAAAARVLNLLERSALRALTQWTVDPAAMPENTRIDGGFIAYVPVKWRLSMHPGVAPPEDKPGEWMLETRTTRHPPSWLPVIDHAPQPGVADLASGELGGVNERFRLATPLNDSGS
ncbi:hypothetical protein [Lysobacter sp. HA35]